MASGSRVVKAHTRDDWEKLLRENADTPIIVDFTATWCGPCRMIGPEFDRLSDVYTEALFLKVDVDENESVAASCGISAMPTFQVWRGGEKVGELVGASKEKLHDLIKQHVKSAAQLATA